MEKSWKGPRPAAITATAWANRWPRRRSRTRRSRCPPARGADMALVNPDFAEELKAYGVDTALECFNCGTCAAICPLLFEHFPRKMIRYVQVGAKDKILLQAQDLWRCLHCGLCTQTCPR